VPQRPSKQLPVLIIQHAPHEHAAVLRRALESQGIPSHVVKIYAGDELPSPTQISGLVSLGGPMGANDEIDFAWIRHEMRFIKNIYAAGQK